jgi:DNA-binding beta-propeller fold protein YncE
VGASSRVRGVVLAAVAACVLGSAVYAFAAGGLVAGPQANGTGVTPIGWTVAPVGKQLTLGDRPYGLAISPNGRFVLASNDGQSTQSLQVIDTAGGNVTQTIPYTGNEALSFGIAFAPNGSKVFVSAGGGPGGSTIGACSLSVSPAIEYTRIWFGPSSAIRRRTRTVLRSPAMGAVSMWRTTSATRCRS